MASESDENKVKDNTFIVSTDKVRIYIFLKLGKIVFWRNIIMYEDTTFRMSHWRQQMVDGSPMISPIMGLII